SYAVRFVAPNNDEGSSTFSNNCYYGETDVIITPTYGAQTLAEWQVSSSQDANSIDDDPVFISGGYIPQADSPCRDTGVDVGLTRDYRDRRIYGNPDIGAYEFGADKSVIYWLDFE
ncbi:unnamed protein product, partial [marine sediment metagenome]